MKQFIRGLIIKYPTLWEIFKFLLVGGFATILDMGVMAFVIYLFNTRQFDYNIFNVIINNNLKPDTLAVVLGTGAGFICGLLFNYILSVSFIYTGDKSNISYAKTKNGFLKFVIFSVYGLSIHIIGMYIGYDILKFNEWIIKIILTLIVLIFNYITRKLLIFKK